MMRGVSGSATVNFRCGSHHAPLTLTPTVASNGLMANAESDVVFDPSFGESVDDSYQAIGPNFIIRFKTRRAAKNRAQGW